MKNMIIVIDVGNTHTVFGFYKDSKLEYSCRFSSDRSRTEDEYFAALQSVTQFNDIDLRNISACALSSVVPNLTRVFSHLAQKYFKCPFISVDGYTDLGLTYPVKDPGFIGADLIVNAFAAKEKYNRPCIICDFGTATTVQLVGKDGHFYGTTISPGVYTSTQSLFEKASMLSNIQLKTPDSLLGTSTKDALLSGIVLGNVYMIDGFIKDIRKEYENLGEIFTIATGGISKLICQSTKEIDCIDRELTLDGLNLIAEKQLLNSNIKEQQL